VANARQLDVNGTSLVSLFPPVFDVPVRHRIGMTDNDRAAASGGVLPTGSGRSSSEGPRLPHDGDEGHGLDVACTSGQCPSRQLSATRSWSLDGRGTNAVPDPSPDGPSHPPPTGAVVSGGKRRGLRMKRHDVLILIWIAWFVTLCGAVIWLIVAPF
jgi:hypothetical protein